MVLWKVGEESPFSNYSEAYKLAECDFVPFHGSAFLYARKGKYESKSKTGIRTYH